MAILKDLVVQGRAKIVDKTYLSDTYITGSDIRIGGGESYVKIGSNDTYVIVDSNDNELNLKCSNGIITLIGDNSYSNGGILVGSSVGPIANNVYSIGTNNYRFKNIYAISMYASNGFYQDSDINKKNILGELSLEKAYELIDKCLEILYTLKNDESNKKLIGMIAQEVQEFFPELINIDENGFLSLDYSRLTVIILKVLKDVIKRLNKIEEKCYE